MNILNAEAFQTMFKGASDIADAAVEIENKELCLSALTFMSDFSYSMSKVIPELFTLLEYRSFFGESAYDSIKVERNKSGSFTALFHKEFNKEFCDAYNITPVVEFKEIGDSYDDARTHVMSFVASWLESLKAKHIWRKDHQPCVNRNDDTKSPDSDTDEGMFQATKGCSGNCAACDHEDE